MSECVECGADGEVETVQHHTNYEKAITVPVCRSCHAKIHTNRKTRRTND